MQKIEIEGEDGAMVILYPTEYDAAQLSAVYETLVGAARQAGLKVTLVREVREELAVP
jgi:adenine-specific DNA methylase